MCLRPLIAFSLSAAALTLMTAEALPGQTTIVSNNVAPWLSKAQKGGRAAPGSQVLVTVYLKPSNQTGLQTLIRNLYTPGNPSYRHFLTPTQFHAAYSPAAGDVAAVQAFLTQQGMKVEYTPANGIYVDASGAVNQVESAFAVTESLYAYNGQTLRANDQSPSIPSSLAAVVAFIGGLDQSDLLIGPHLRTGDPHSQPGVGYSTPGPCSTYWSDHTANASGAGPYTGLLPWTPCGYTPAQIRAAYNVNGQFTGKNVRVGITDAFASPTIVDDVNRFSVHYGLPLLTAANFQQIVVPGTFNFPENKLDPAGWYGEESLDIEWVHAMAPEATIVFAGAQNSLVPLDHALIHLIDQGLADIITNSWGATGDLLPPGHILADEAAFMQAAAQGISVLFSSGDDGDVAALTGLAMGSWPATSPFVTAVGGTSLGVLNAAGSKVEWGWGSYTSSYSNPFLGPDPSGVLAPWPPEFLYGSGGGPSLNFAQPWYQQGIVSSQLSTKTVDANGNSISLGSARRVVPDISMDADPNTGALYGQTYNVSGDALVDAGCTALPGNREYCERRIGGTSLSSPMFAGMLALVNQARAGNSKGPIGFVNPALYTLGSGGSGAPIVDVLAPSNPGALLRNFEVASGLQTALRTVNSVPKTSANNSPVIEGADTSLRTASGYDNVTGLGTPNISALIDALKQ